jgi:hypothetical protein
MNYTRLILSAFILISFVAFLPQNSLADNPSKKFAHKVYVGTGYGNDMIYDGSSQTASQPFYSADIYYIFKSKLWASAVAYNLPGYNLTVPVADLSVGFNHNFNENFDMSVSLSEYMTATEVKEALHDNFTFLRVKAGLDWYYMYTTFSVGTLFSEVNSYYFYLRNSKYFKTPNLGKNKNIYFSFDPTVNTVFGTSTWYETVTSPGGFFGRPGTTTEVAHTSLNFVKLELTLPVALNINRFSIEADPVWLIPARSSDGIDKKGGFFFFLSAYVRVF